MELNGDGPMGFSKCTVGLLSPERSVRGEDAHPARSATLRVGRRGAAQSESSATIVTRNTHRIGHWRAKALREALFVSSSTFCETNGLQKIR
jgi:hypothetical protein